MDLRPVSVVVAGAGLAGLVVARDLARAGCHVQVLESRGHPGGAVFSYHTGGHLQDNSLHLFLGCYRECLRLLGELGTADLVEAQPPVFPLWSPRRSGRLVLRPAAGPMALPLALIGCGFWPLRDRLRLLKAGADLRRVTVRPGECAGDLLERLSIGSAVREFWGEWALSVFNGRLEDLDGGLFRTTLLGMFRDTGSARPWLARAPLDTLLISPLVRDLSAAGGTLHCRSAVKGVRRLANGRLEVTTPDRTRDCDHLVWAADPGDLAAVWQPGGLPALPRTGRAAGIANLRFTVRHWPWRENLLGTFGSRFQFIFAPPTPQARDDRTVVLVASGLEDVTTATLADEGTALLARLALEPTTGPVVVRQPRALPLQTPEWQQARPRAGSLAPGLWVCGAWCATGLPLTMESAVLSARQLADTMAKSGIAGVGRPATRLKPCP